MDKLVLERQEDILRIAARHGGDNVRVFGSRARDEAEPESDLDLLIDLERGRDLLDLAAMQEDLEEILGCPVDVISEDSLSGAFRETVLEEAVTLPLPEGQGLDLRSPAQIQEGRARYRVRRDRWRLEHILEAAARIEEYTAVGRERFLQDARTQDAVIRQLEIMGEAVKRLSPELRRRHPEVQWRRVARTRDALIHEYPRVNLETVWDISQRDVPELRKAAQRMLAE